MNLFRINEEAYGQFIALNHWNDPDRWATTEDLRERGLLQMKADVHRLKSDTHFLYTPPAGTHGPGTTVTCGVCESPTDARYRRKGARTFIEMFAGIEAEYDEYCCPHANEGWHRQAVALRKEAAATASKRAEDALRAEADEIISRREATKTV